MALSYTKRSETKEMDHQGWPSTIYHSICTHPSTSVLWPKQQAFQGQWLGPGPRLLSFFLPSFLPLPFPSLPFPGSTFPPSWTLSGLCQSNEQSLNCSMARKQMEPWDDLQCTETENEGGKRAAGLKRGVRNALSKCSFGQRAQNMPDICTFFQFISYWIKVSDCWTPFNRIQQRKKRKTEWKRRVSEEGLNLCTPS